MPVGDELYEALGPLTESDVDHGYALRTYCTALGKMFQQLETYVRDTAIHDGWTVALDVERAPTEALPYLAQFVGVILPTGTGDADARTRIRAAAGMQRGTVESLRQAALSYLTGAKYIRIVERLNSPYRFGVFVRQNEVPDTAALQQALLEVKPAGLVMELYSTTGESWNESTTSTWNSVSKSWDDLETQSIP